MMLGNQAEAALDEMGTSPAKDFGSLRFRDLAHEKAPLLPFL